MHTKMSIRRVTRIIIVATLARTPLLVALNANVQRTLARSSTKAEFKCVASTTMELEWVTSLLFELGYKSAITLTIFCDNLSAIHYLTKPVINLD